jgi:PAS domain S-box-containing protein
MQDFPYLKQNLLKIENAKSMIISNWMTYKAAKDILEQHKIEIVFFQKKYAENVFDYFMAVIRGAAHIGYCPVIEELLKYLKGKNFSSKDLFIICSHFKLSMVEASYDLQINSKELLKEISYIFDNNFSSVLAIYADTIYEKDIEIEKNVELLEQYIYALNESALVSKTDSEGFITHVNQKFIDLCGYQKQELIGRRHNIMRHKDMAKQFFKSLWTTIKSGDIFSGTIKNKNKKGAYFYIDTTIIPFVDPFTGNREYMAIGFEVTKLVDARLKAIAADKAKDYFLSNMSHEIRTPLNAILGFVSLLQSEDISQRHRNYLEIIHSSGENLLHIINDILDFSKLRSGEFTIEPKVFNFETALSKIMELFLATASQKQIAIFSYIDPNLPSEFMGDELRIGQIISNFLSNAIKFTTYQGSIEIIASYSNGKLEISVKDSGIGINKKDLKNIFDAFTQVQNNFVHKSGGSGLGLSICKQLAEKMGGKLSVASKLGQGSTFTLVLPIEVVNKEVLHYDCKMLKNKKIFFYVNEKTQQRKLDLFLKYYEQMGIELHLVDSIDQAQYDLLYFFENDLDELTRFKIIQSEQPTIEVTDYMNEAVNRSKNITKLCFPVYISKLRTKTLEALGLGEAYSLQRVINTMSKGYTGHLLIAEDNEANQELMRIILQKYGLTFDLVDNGKDAVALFEKNSYDLVLLDDQMPLQNGLESAHLMLEIEKTKTLEHTPIAMLTANVIKGSRERSMIRSVDEFLGKPIELVELEKLFDKYLYPKDKMRDSDFNMRKLQDALQLDSDQVKLLLGIYIIKMDESLMNLSEAIQQKDYAKIAKFSHSIKGSSANFRFDEIQQLADMIEKSSKNFDEEFLYKETLQKIELLYNKIKINQFSM